MNSGRRGGLGASTAAGVLLLLSLAGCAGGPAATPDAGSAQSASVSSPAAPGTAPVQPPAPAEPSAAAPAAAPPGEQFPPVMGASAPLTVSIPSIGLRTGLLHLGLRENGSLEVPADTGNGAPASW